MLNYNAQMDSLSTDDVFRQSRYVMVKPCQGKKPPIDRQLWLTLALILGTSLTVSAIWAYHFDTRKDSTKENFSSKESFVAPVAHDFPTAPRRTAPSYTSTRHKERLRGDPPNNQAQSELFPDLGIFSGIIRDVAENIGGKIMRFTDVLQNTVVRKAKSDMLTARDRFYAKLVQMTYPVPKDRKSKASSGSQGIWLRKAELDSEYISVWDQQGSQRRFIAVRGTKTENEADILEDMKIMFSGTCGNRIGSDLSDLIYSSGAKTVEIGGHSLGCTLIFRAYDAYPQLLGHVRKTYQYNPPYSPRWLVRGVENRDCLSKKFERDSRIRMFINLYDLVSIGGGYGSGPRNAVYHTAKDAGVDGWELSLENGVKLAQSASAIIDGVLGNGENQQLSESSKKFLKAHKLSQWIDGSASELRK